MSKINLDITDFGPINNANIKLNKLNIIAGENGSGKSTSSKLLYCFLTSLSNEREYLANLSINKRIVTIINNLNKEFEFNNETSHKLKKEHDKFPKLSDETYNENIKTSINSLKKIIEKSQLSSKEEYLKKLNDIESTLEVNNIKNRQLFDVSNALLTSEFKIKDLKLNNPNVKFYGQKNNCKFSYKLHLNDSKLGFKIINGDLNCLNSENIIYIDSPSIFDSYSMKNSIILKNQQYHLKFLSKMLNLSKNNEDIYDSMFNKKLDKIITLITELIGGCIYYDYEEEEFIFKKGNENYSMKNTASGVKQLGIIQILLSNRALTENSFLIMDEPEVNIHPEWQVRLAEILVLLVKDLNINIFINSHSPHFIEAIEVYSIKYALRDETNFYLTKKDENNEKFNVKKIEYKNLYELYDNLGDPYDIIDEVRGENIANHL